MVRRIAITGLKGGCGRTTIAVNLSSAVALRGHKTLLIDMDPRADATRSLGVAPQENDSTIYELLMGSEDSLTKVVASTAVSGLHLVPSDMRLSGAELELADEPDRARKLASMLERLEEGYSLVVVDCPANFGLLTMNALCACPEALVPVIGGSLPVASVDAIMEITDNVKRQMGLETRIIGLTPNMVDKRVGAGAAAIKKMEEKYGKRMVRSRIRMDAKLAEAASSGKPIQMFAPKSNSAFDFDVLADDIMAL